MSRAASPPRDVLVARPDAGPAAGLGHLRRCLTVAGALADLGTATVFVLPAGPATALAAAEGFAVEPAAGPPGSEADLAALLAAVARHGAGAVLVDGYAADAAWLDALGQATGPGVHIAVFDDLCREPLPCALVVNGGLGAEQLPYRGAPGHDPRLLLGAAYAPLRPAFATVGSARAASGAAAGAGAAGPPRVLVTFGGSDPAGMTPRALAALDLVAGPLAAVAVVGPLAANADAVRAAAAAARHPVEVVVAPPDLPALVADAALALSAGGGTLVELAAAGVPAVAVEVAANQRRGIAALAEAGAVVTAGAAGDPAPGLEQRLAAEVAALLADPGRRGEMAAAGRGLVDGQGARRIAEALAALVRS